MIPILYGKQETAFQSNGLGRLSDAISCVVTEERNGSYELVMEYYEKGKHASEIETDMIIYAKPAAFSTDQAFRIYKITKPLNQKFKICARHISYDLAYVSVMPFGPYGNASEAMNGLATHADGLTNFSIGSVTVSSSGTFAVNEPASFRNLIGGREGSILDVFGGEIEWDNFRVNLWASRGRDRGLTLRYGKNISDISQQKDIDYTITGITPYMQTANDEILTLPEKTVYKSGVSYTTPRRVQAMDMRSYVDEKAIREANPEDTEEQIKERLVTALRTAAQAYANANLSGVQDSSIEVAFVNLGDTEEYKGIASLFTQAGICDTVTVQYERLGISVQAKIIKTEYNVLQERFNKITIGKARANLGNVVSGLSKDISKTASDASASANAIREAGSLEALQAALQAALNALNDAKAYADTKDIEKLATAKGYTDTQITANNAIVEAYADDAANRAINTAAQNTSQAIAANSNIITGNTGGYVVIRKDSNNKPYEILIMDTNDISTARKVWRWNQNGLGYSSTGYNGTYTTALSKDGVFNTDFIAANTLSGQKIISGTLDAGKITTGILNAALIKTGLLADYAGKNSINMLTGEFSLANGNLFFSTSQNYVQLTNNLSLRINGIPLAGMNYTSFRVNTSISGVNIGADILRMPYLTFANIRINIDENKTLPDEEVIIWDMPAIDKSFESYRWVIFNRTYPSTGDQHKMQLLDYGSYHTSILNNDGSISGGSKGKEYRIELIYKSLPG